MTVVTVHQAKTQLSRLIAAAETGEEIIIARGTTPVVRLTPVKATDKPRRQFGRLKGIIAFDDRFFDPMSKEDRRLWEGRGTNPIETAARHPRPPLVAGGRSQTARALPAADLRKRRRPCQRRFRL